jgi:hypothetical protein
VKRGLWTNWSKGTVMGKTITTEAQTGTVIVVRETPNYKGVILDDCHIFFGRRVTLTSNAYI